MGSRKVKLQVAHFKLSYSRAFYSRKNWLFSQTAADANASAILYNIIEIVKANDLTVFEYVMNSIELLSQPESDVGLLLPWQFAKD